MAYTIIAEKQENEKITIKNLTFINMLTEIKWLNYKYNNIKKIEIIKEK